MLHTIIFIGRSGSGKGTQAGLFKDRIHRLDGDNKRNILYIETGEHFRKFAQGTSLASKLSEKMMTNDERQPDFLASWMWSNILIDDLSDDMHLVFDGAPRACQEAEMLTDALQFFKREKPVVIHLEVSRDWSEKHLLKRGRSDDVNIARIDKRLDWFDTDVVPALKYFKNDPYYRLIEINGEQSIDKVHSDIVSAYEYQA